MAIITLRQSNVISSPGATVKGSPLTNSELDNNFANINIVLGVLDNLTTTAKSNLVTAINEVVNDIATVTTVSSGSSNIVATGSEVKVSGSFQPFTTDVFDIGSPILKFGNGWFNGNVSANYFTGNGSALTGIVSGATIADETTYNSSSFYPVLANNQTSGTFLDATVSSSKLSFNTLTGTLTTANISLSGELYAANLKSYKEKITDLGDISGNQNVDLTLGNLFKANVIGNIDFTFTNPPSSSYSQPVTLILTHGVAGTLANVNNSKYTDGVRPVLSTGLNEVDVLTYFTVDGGSTWYGTFAMANVSYPS